INHSGYENTLEPSSSPASEHVLERHDEMRDDIHSTHAIRLGLCRILGLKEDHARLIVERRGKGYRSVQELWLKTGVPIPVMQKLAEADAFNSIGLKRRE